MAHVANLARRPSREGREVYEVPGEHGSLIFEPHVGAWAPLLRARIEAATGSDGG